MYTRDWWMNCPFAYVASEMSSSTFVFDCELPASLALANNAYGRMIIATRPFNAGELVGMGRFYYSEPGSVEFRVRIFQEGAMIAQEDCNFIHTAYIEEYVARTRTLIRTAVTCVCIHKRAQD